jgi:uncharacterized protein (UPF0254 family)
VWPAIRERCQHGGLIGFSAAAGKYAISLITRQAKLLCNREHEVPLHLSGEGTVTPRRELGIHRCHQCICRDTH